MMPDLFSIYKPAAPQILLPGVSSHQPGILLSQDGHIMRHARIPLVHRRGFCAATNTTPQNELTYTHYYIKDGSTVTANTDETALADAPDRIFRAYADYEHYIASSSYSSSAPTSIITSAIKSLLNTARAEIKDKIRGALSYAAPILPTFQHETIGGEADAVTLSTTASVSCAITALHSTRGASGISSSPYIHLSAGYGAQVDAPTWVAFPGTAGGCPVTLEVTLVAGGHTTGTGNNYKAVDITPSLWLYDISDVWDNQIPTSHARFLSSINLNTITLPAATASADASVTATQAVVTQVPTGRLLGIAINPGKGENLFDYADAMLESGYSGPVTSSFTKYYSRASHYLNLVAKITIRPAEIGN
jgi:hypothetical protein